jgi:hypothetical protein
MKKPLKKKRPFNFKYKEVRYGEINMGYLFVMDTKIKSSESPKENNVTKTKKRPKSSLFVDYLKFSSIVLSLWITCSFFLVEERDLFDLTLFGPVLGLI